MDNVRIIPASLSISFNCSAGFISRSFDGVNDHTLIIESANPMAMRLESSEISALKLRRKLISVTKIGLHNVQTSTEDKL